MKTIELHHAAPDLADLLAQARQDDLVVQLADGSEFLVVAIDDFDQEIAWTRQNPKIMALLESRSRGEKTLSLDEVERRFGL